MCSVYVPANTAESQHLSKGKKFDLHIAINCWNDDSLCSDVIKQNFQKNIYVFQSFVKIGFIFNLKMKISKEVIPFFTYQRKQYFRRSFNQIV